MKDLGVHTGVSVILPTYNRAHCLGRAIQSVLSQTHEKLELLIIDDGSTDDTESLVRSYTDRRIKYFRFEENGGQSKARNYGMQMASYDYLAFEDSDDIYLPRKLELQLGALAGTDDAAGICYHKFRYDLGMGQSCILPDESIPDAQKSGNIYRQMLWDNLIGMPALMIKKSCIEKVGQLNETMNCLEDYEFALRLTKAYKAVFLPEILLEAAYSTTGVSGNSYHYLLASCQILGKYKQDYLATDTLNHRLDIILRDAAKIGQEHPFIKLLENIMLL